VENSSASPTSPDWPTHWLPDAFSWWRSIAVAIGLLLLILVVSAIVVGIYLRSTGAGPLSLTHPTLGLALGLQIILDIAIVVFLVLILPRLARLSLRDLGFTVPTWRQVGIAVLGAIAMVLVVNLLGSAIESFFHVKHQQDVIKIALSINKSGMKAVFAVVALVGAPLMEEFSFRIFIFNAVRRHWGFWGGAIVSAIVFGLAHADPYAFVPLAIGGIILCTVYYKTRNAWTSMITHALFNSVTIVALFVDPALLKQ
jgi:hypothetical protein